jgi:putative tricarboxylic transport membrane protein
MYIETFLNEFIALATPMNMAIMAAAVVMGMLFGALPGLTATLAVALLSSVTFGMSTELAMVALIGAYVGAIYGPSHTSILLGIPGRRPPWTGIFSPSRGMAAKRSPPPRSRP